MLKLGDGARLYPNVIGLSGEAPNPIIAYYTNKTKDNPNSAASSFWWTRENWARRCPVVGAAQWAEVVGALEPESVN